MARLACFVNADIEMALGHMRCQSGGVIEHPSAQQVKAGAAVHLSLEHLYIGWSGVKPW